jgi:signal transduction histidine kinase
VALLVAAVSVALAWGAYAATRWTLERNLERCVEECGRRVESVLAQSERDIRHQLTRLGHDLTTRRTALFERLARPGPVASEDLDAAAALADLSSLDLLEIVSPAGVVLSSAHWPERAGTTDSTWRAGDRDRSGWAAVGSPSGEHPAFVAHEPVQVGDLEIHLLGGAWLTADRLENLAGPGGAMVLEVGGDPVLATAALDPAPSVQGRPGRLVGPGGRGWPARMVALTGGEGEPDFGHLWVALDPAATAAELRALRNVLAVAVALVMAAGVVIGFALARRATRPVDEAIRAIEAIAAGEADYSFSWKREDRLEELPQAFSMLHRSLDDQQRRRAAAERVAAWREVARRVAHEIKNPLAPIRITVQNLVKARRQAPEAFDEILDEGSRAILEEVDQLQRIVTEFSEFARLPEPRWAPTDLDEVVDEVVALYSGAPGVREVRLRGDSTPRLNADAGLLSRVIKNLVANAVEAMGEKGGTLTVETGRDGGFVFVSVRDTGPGFSGESAARAFEPYFTTKAKGTGLGMAIADRVVTEHGGFIVTSNPKEGGAEVVVKLPAREPAEETP